MDYGNAQPQQPQQNIDLTRYQKNPYLDTMATNIGNQMSANWNRNLAPSIRGGAASVGGFGGSRQGVVEANGLNDLNRGLSDSLTNMYGQDYNNQMNRNLQQYQGDQTNALGNKQADNSYNLGMGNLGLGYQNSNNANQLGNKQADNSFTLGMGSLGLQNQGQQNQYDLGLRSSDLGFAGLDANINQNNVNNQFRGAEFGMSVQNQLMQNNQTGLTAGTQMQNTPMNYFNNFSNSANSIGNGYGTNTTGSSSNPLMGALGGAQLGYQVGNYFGGGAGYGGPISGVNDYNLGLGASNNPSAYSA